MTDTHHFAIVTRDESWLLDGRRVVESRLIHGVAVQRGNTIEARDDCDEKLLALCDREANRVREALARFGEGRARAVVSARGDEGVSATISLSLGDLSVVTTPANLTADYAMLVELAGVHPSADADYRTIPLVWRNGSGAVLMHEAVGHPLELGVKSGGMAAAVQISFAQRRQSFSDVPLRRMTLVRLSGLDAGFRTPSEPFLEILLVAGGRYDPLTDGVSLSISAAKLVDGDFSVRVRPFEIAESRQSVERALVSAAAAVKRYPGVICSAEGQNVYVGSYAPDLLTDFRCR